MNHLDLSTSYEEVERIDIALVQHTIDMTGSYRVPVPSSIVLHELVHRAVDNFDQNVLLQKGLESGPLWCDEGVYRIAKELQLLNPDKFANIFVRLGGFHLEKVVIACCGKYLEESGIDSISVKLEIFGPEVVTSVMADGNYVRGKRGIALISALQRLQFSEFIKTVDISKFSKLFVHIAELQTLFRTENGTPESIKSAWTCCRNEINEFNEAFSLFKDRCSKASEQFQYFNIFLERTVPVLRDLT